MKILDVCVIAGDSVLQGDVLESDDGFWLIPGWLETQGDDWKMPIRMIRLDTIPHQRLSTGDFILDTAIPESVLEGFPLNEEAAPYEVVVLPNIRIPIALPAE